MERKPKLQQNLPSINVSLWDYEGVMKFVTERTYRGVNGIDDFTEIDKAKKRLWDLREKRMIREAEAARKEEERQIKLILISRLIAFLPILAFSVIIYLLTLKS